jgi:DHA1 family multidrug resistance protein-like MFS transporter
MTWKRNFYTLWIAEIVAIVGFQSIQPFLPYYVQQFEVKDLADALVWAGRMSTAAGLAMALSSPFWGVLADRFGRKPMVVRAMLGGGVTVVLMAYVTSLEQLLAARVLQGALAGTVTACITMVSTTTPREHLGYALGLMQGAFLLGGSLGPLLGGPLIDLFGYRTCILVSGALVVLAGIAVQLWVREDFHRLARTSDAAEWRLLLQDARRLLGIRTFLVLLMILSLIQFVFGLLTPVTPLFLQQLAGTDDIVAMAGLIFSVSGLAGAVSSALMGKWSGWLGVKTALVGGLVATSVLYVAQGCSTSVGMLAVLMVLASLAAGAIRPVANALIAQVVPEDDHGKAFGVMSSANALGWSMGPIAGSSIGAAWGFRMVYFLTALLSLVVAMWVWRAMRSVDLGTQREVDLRLRLRARLRLMRRARS